GPGPDRAGAALPRLGPARHSADTGARPPPPTFGGIRPGPARPGAGRRRPSGQSWFGAGTLAGSPAPGEGPTSGPGRIKRVHLPGSKGLPPRPVLVPAVRG